MARLHLTYLGPFTALLVTWVASCAEETGRDPNSIVVTPQEDSSSAFDLGPPCEGRTAMETTSLIPWKATEASTRTTMERPTRRTWTPTGMAGRMRRRRERVRASARRSTTPMRTGFLTCGIWIRMGMACRIRTSTPTIRMARSTVERRRIATGMVWWTWSSWRRGRTYGQELGAARRHVVLRAPLQCRREDEGLHLLHGVKAADIYFMVDTTDSMQPAIDDVAASLNTEIIPSILTGTRRRSLRFRRSRMRGLGWGGHARRAVGSLRCGGRCALPQLVPICGERAGDLGERSATARGSAVVHRTGEACSRSSRGCRQAVVEMHRRE